MEHSTLMDAKQVIPTTSRDVMPTPAFIQETLTATTDGYEMVLNNEQLIRHVYDVLIAYHPNIVVEQVNVLTLRNSRHRHDQNNIPIPLIAFLFENLTSLSLSSVSCVVAPEPQHLMVSVRQLLLTHVDFYDPLNLFPFIALFPALTDLGIQYVQSTMAMEEDDVELLGDLTVLRLAGSGEDTLDLWFLQWMVDNATRVPEFEHIILSDVDDETADLIALLLHQEGYHMYRADITIKENHEYAYDTLTNTELFLNMEWQVEYVTHRNE